VPRCAAGFSTACCSADGAGGPSVLVCPRPAVSRAVRDSVSGGRCPSSRPGRDAGRRSRWAVVVAAYPSPCSRCSARLPRCGRSGGVRADRPPPRGPGRSIRRDPRQACRVAPRRGPTTEWLGRSAMRPRYFDVAFAEKPNQAMKVSSTAPIKVHRNSTGPIGVSSPPNEHCRIRMHRVGRPIAFLNIAGRLTAAVAGERDTPSRTVPRRRGHGVLSPCRGGLFGRRYRKGHRSSTPASSSRSATANSSPSAAP
jgi:hypothetical protein